MNRRLSDKALHYIALAINTTHANQAQEYEDMAYEYAVRVAGIGLFELHGPCNRPVTAGFGTGRSGRRPQRYHVEADGHVMPPWALGAGDLVRGV